MKNFFQVGKRILLFALVNVLVLISLSIVVNLLLKFFPGLQRGKGWLGILAILSLVIGMGGAFISLAVSRWMAKAFMGVQVVDPDTNHPELRELVRMVHGFAQRAGLPAMPEVGIYESPEVNAFATGPSKSRSLVAVSTGLLRQMNRAEAEGVIAHEVAHIANGDMVTMTLLQGIMNAFVMFFARLVAYAITSRGDRDDERGGSYMMYFMVRMVLEIGLGILGSVITAWFSRQREFRADHGGAELAGRDRMIGALRRLMSNRELVDTQHQALATLKINGAKGFMMLLATHPPLEDRIAALEQIG